MPLLLAGPILRRVEPTSVCVWLAFSTAQADVKISLWEGRKKHDTTDTPLHQSAPFATRLIGKGLHLALVTLTLPAGTPKLKPSQLYSYNVQFGGKDLKSEGLLQDKTEGGLTLQLGLGYEDGFLPSFVMPADKVENLRLAHGSCRKMHGKGNDALAHLDDFVKKNLKDANRTQLLVLTGDQIYADEVPWLGLHYINATGRELIGTKEELTIKKTGQEGADSWPEKATLSLENFPPLFRAHFVNRAARFTGNGIPNHLLSFGEYCATYLYYWSPVAWHSELTDFMKNLAAKEVQNLADQKQYCITEIFDKKLKTPLANLPNNMKPLWAGERFKEIFEQPNLNEWIKKGTNGEYEEVRSLLDFWLTLPKVARVLANVPTLMMFDDHEVTDDWNFTRRWKNQVYKSNPAGGQIVRNALMAYALFQDWGNQPEAYKSGNKKTFLEKIERYASSCNTGNVAGDVDMTELLGLDGEAEPTLRWHYQAPVGPAQLLVMDTRTRRTYEQLNSSPTLLPKSAFDEVLPAPADLPIPNPPLVFIVSPVPVLGPPMIEGVAQRAVGIAETLNKGVMTDNNPDTHFAGEGAGFTAATLKRDMEAWGFNVAALEALLQRLAAYKTVVFLSGDVHYGYSATLDYWKEGKKENHARFVQLTASAFKNAWSLNLQLLNSGFGQRLLGAVDSIEMHGWQTNKPQFTGAPSLANRLEMNKKPILLATATWTPDARVTTPPDWQWRLKMVRDVSVFAEDAITVEQEKALATPATATEDNSKAAYSALLARHLKLFTQGKTRLMMWNTHFGEVSFQKQGDALTLQHTFHFAMPVNGFVWSLPNMVLAKRKIVAYAAINNQTEYQIGGHLKHQFSLTALSDAERNPPKLLGAP